MSYETTNYYKVLGLDSSADAEDIEAAFRYKCERHADDFEAQLRFGEARMALLDPERRAMTETAIQLRQIAAEPARYVQAPERSQPIQHVHHVQLGMAQSPLTDFLFWFTVGTVAMTMFMVMRIVW